MDIRQFLDATYLKTPEQAGLSSSENNAIVHKLVEEAIEQHYKLVMIRPDRIAESKQHIMNAGSKVLVGTVIDFPDGNGSTEDKLREAMEAITNGADELDFVVNYSAFKAENSAMVKSQVLECTRLGLEHYKTVKWIIETAALNDHQIVQLSALIKNVVLTHFEEEDYSKVFVKSSTGFFRTDEGKPNGATLAGIKLMLENSFPLPVKAAGGVKNFKEAEAMIALGVKRIGTSSALEIISGQNATDDY